MSTFVPLFKRRWFKNTLILSVVTAIGLGGAYATFYHLSSFERLQRLSTDVMQGSTRKITFDAQMERQLFPRPTVVLKNVMLSETDGRTPAISRVMTTGRGILPTYLNNKIRKLNLIASTSIMDK